jgi:hypothetical protein
MDTKETATASSWNIRNTRTTYKGIIMATQPLKWRYIRFFMSFQTLGQKLSFGDKYTLRNKPTSLFSNYTCLNFKYSWLSLYAFSHIRGSISVLWGANIPYPRPTFKAYYLRLTFSSLIRECDTDDKLCIKEFWRQFNTKTAIYVRFPFYAYSLHAVITRNAEDSIKMDLRGK